MFQVFFFEIDLASLAGKGRVLRVFQELLFEVRNRIHGLLSYGWKAENCQKMLAYDILLVNLVEHLAI
jgi:hypothetical protein